jgi:hypothetical protein
MPKRNPEHIVHHLDCCRCGVPVHINQETLERYDRESKVLLCCKCEGNLKLNANLEEIR